MMSQPQLFSPKSIGWITVFNIVALTAINLGATWNQPSLAANQVFWCGKTKDGTFATFRSTNRGRQPLIRWVSNSAFPPPYNAEQRCQIVSNRFQTNYDNQTLKMIKTDRLNGYPVVCAATSQSDRCNHLTLLFTLKPGSNPKTVLARLLDARGMAAARILSESSCADCPVYLNFDAYLDSIPVEADDSSNGQPTQ